MRFGNATRVRQQAILDLKNVDCLIVVGDPTSNNSQKLVDIGKQAGIEHVFSIQTAEDIDKKDFEKYTTIAITSGASTPTYLTNQVKRLFIFRYEKTKNPYSGNSVSTDFFYIFNFSINSGLLTLERIFLYLFSAKSKYAAYISSISMFTPK